VESEISQKPSIKGQKIEVRPNPFTNITTIRYQLATSGPAKLTVYNIAGQAVRLLVHERRPAGNNEVIWNGRGESMLPLPPGVYFIRLETPEFRKVGRVVLMR